MTRHDLLVWWLIVTGGVGTLAGVGGVVSALMLMFALAVVLRTAAPSLEATL